MVPFCIVTRMQHILTLSGLCAHMPQQFLAFLQLLSKLLLHQGAEAGVSPGFALFVSHCLY